MADLGAIGVGNAITGILYNGVVSGIVHNASGNPARRRVIAIHSDSASVSGSAFSDPVTGNYSIDISPVRGKTQHIIIEQSPDGSENARVFDNVIPL